MKKIFRAILSLFIIIMPFCGIVKAVGEPKGENKVVVDILWRTVTSGTEFAESRGFSVDYLAAQDKLLLPRLLLNDKKVPYGILKFYYGDDQEKKVFLLSQEEGGQLRSYVCDFSLAFMINFLGRKGNPEAGRECLFMNIEEYIMKVVKDPLLRTRRIEWLDKDGKVLATRTY